MGEGAIRGSASPRRAPFGRLRQLRSSPWLHLRERAAPSLPGCRNLCLVRFEITDLEVEVAADLVEEVAAGLGEAVEAGGLAEEDLPDSRKQRLAVPQ